MARKRWDDIKRERVSEARLAEIRAETLREVTDLNLKAIRELAGVSQVELAGRMGTGQSEISRAEQRDDHLLSTLRDYVEALGGELEVIAHFGDKTVRLHGV
jgi:DNA-binding transcriptional regulator YiaG